MSCAANDDADNHVDIGNSHLAVAVHIGGQFGFSVTGSVQDEEDYRVDVGNGINSLETVVSREDQFLGYSDGNPVLDNYYQLAKQFVTDWHNEDVKPCDFSYQWAELTDKGIFLVNEFGADGYARRWQAS